MRQHYRTNPLIGGRLVILQPEDLGSCESRGKAVSDFTPVPGFSSGSFLDGQALGNGTGVVPQLGRPDHLIIPVEDHQPMLLPGHPDTPDLFQSDTVPPELRQAILKGSCPNPGMLFLVPRGQPGDQVIGRGAGYAFPDIRPPGQYLQTLGSAVDAKIDHGKIL